MATASIAVVTRSRRGDSKSRQVQIKSPTTLQQSLVTCIVHCFAILIGCCHLAPLTPKSSSTATARVGLTETTSRAQTEVRKPVGGSY